MVHIGIIPDGNRRWCKKNELEQDNLNNYWRESFVKSIKYFFNETNEPEKDKIINILKKIKEVSFYVCSIDNIYRKDNTKNLIFDFIRFLYDFYINLKKNFKKYSINANINSINEIFIKHLNINFIGDLELLPKDIQNMIQEIKKRNNKNHKYRLNLAIAYDYIKDLKNFGSEKKDKNYIRTQSNIDIIIRSGGEFRTSGFFPTKILYSELFFFKKYWPEMELKDLLNVLKKFKKRNRRFGK